MAHILYALLGAMVLPIMLSWVSAYARMKQFGTIDNNHPRQQQAELEGVGARAVAAQSNAWEALMLYTATCVIVVAAGLDLASLEMFACIFLGARVLHGVFYIANLGILRSLSFLAAAGSCFYMIYLAATLAI